MRRTPKYRALRVVVSPEMLTVKSVLMIKTDANAAVAAMLCGPPYSSATAAELVRRWNAHEDLLSACEHVLNCFDEEVDIDGDRIRAAIAKAVDK